MIREAITFSEAKIEAYKFLKKKLNIMATYYTGNFKATKTFDRGEYIIHYNDKDFDKPVYEIEWK